jgi:N-acetylmuramoyl-L-alanine amidase
MRFSRIPGSKRYLRVAALGLMVWGALAGSASPLWAASVRIVLPDRSTGIPVVMILRRPYVDALAAANLVSGQLQVDAAQGHATLQMGSHSLAVRLGSAEVRIASRTVPLSSAPVLQGRRFLLPMDILPVLLAERYGQEAVEWDPGQRVMQVRSQDATITKLRVGAYPTHTRVVLETLGPLEWSIERDAERNGLRVFVPKGVLASNIRPITIRTGTVRGIQPTQHAGGAEVRLTREWGDAGLRTFTLTNPDRIVIDVLAGPDGKQGQAGGREGGGVERTSQPPGDAASLPPDGGQVATRSTLPVPDRDPGLLMGVPALMTVVLDPGHGGHDTGAIGPTGLMEKDVVLDLALRLRRLLQERLGIRVIMTRTEDVFIPLQERAAMANRAKADFFVSLHANGATKRGAVGFETFYFTREPSDHDARASAQRENLVIESDGARGRDQDSLLRITLADMAVTRDMRESSELAELVLTSLDKLLKVENRGVKSGPFYVLATAAMPAILVESAFITNPKEERQLQREAYRQRLAEALYEGIAKYKDRYERRVGVRGGSSAAAES